MNSGGREGGRSLDVGVLFGVTQSSTFQSGRGRGRRRIEECAEEPFAAMGWGDGGALVWRLKGEEGARK